MGDKVCRIERIEKYKNILTTRMESKICWQKNKRILIAIRNGDKITKWNVLKRFQHVLLLSFLGSQKMIRGQDNLK